MSLKITARSIDDSNVEYQVPEKHGLSVKIKKLQGTGQANDPVKTLISITNNAKTEFTGIIHIELLLSCDNPRFFLPAFMYGLNRGEFPQNVPHNFPRLRKTMSYPSSPFWFTRSDRLSHPVALVFDNNKVLGFNASPYLINENNSKIQWEPSKHGDFCQYTGFSCNYETNSIGYTLGYENAPWLFVQSKRSFEREKLSDNCIALYSCETIAFTMEFYNYPADDETGINGAIENVYYKYHQQPRDVLNVFAATKLLSRAIYDYSWIEEDKNYSTFVFEKENGFERRALTSTSWTNGLSVAVPMFISGIRLGDNNMKQQAQKCIDNIVRNSINPKSQLPFDACVNGVWSTKGWWYDGLGTAGHTAYIIGQSVYYILKAYKYDKEKNNCVHDAWLLFAAKIMEKVEKEKNTDKEYPFIFSENTGAGLEYDALGSAWCLAAGAYLCCLTNKTDNLLELEQSEEHYYNAYVKHMECYGAPLDTSKATDSEGILAYIRAVRLLHELTKKDKYLAHLRDALCYEFTFKFCYNSPIKIPPLSTIGWSSCGGSVTSVANPHIHPMSSSVAGEILYYCTHQNDDYIRQRLNDVIKWGCQTFNTYDKEFGHGKIGWMSERFCHCQGLVCEKYADGTPASTWFAQMAWAGASILDGFTSDYWDTINPI